MEDKVSECEVVTKVTGYRQVLVLISDIEDEERVGDVILNTSHIQCEGR